LAPLAPLDVVMAPTKAPWASRRTSIA